MDIPPQVIHWSLVAASVNLSVEVALSHHRQVQFKTFRLLCNSFSLPAPQVTYTVIRVFSTQTSESTTASCRRSVRHGLHSFGSCFPLIHPLSTLPLFLSSTVILTLEWATERRGTGSLHLGMYSWKERKERRKRLISRRLRTN